MWLSLSSVHGGCGLLSQHNKSGCRPTPGAISVTVMKHSDQSEKGLQFSIPGNHMTSTVESCCLHSFLPLDSLSVVPHMLRAGLSTSKGMLEATLIWVFFPGDSLPGFIAAGGSAPLASEPLRNDLLSSANSTQWLFQTQPGMSPKHVNPALRK